MARKKALGKSVPRSSCSAQTWNPFPVQHARDLHAIGDRTKSDWSHGFGLPQTSLVQTAGNRRSKMGNQSPRNFDWWVWPILANRRHCQTRPTLLEKGRWNEKQILPESWVEQATSKQVSNGSDPTKDWDQGYGFQFWRCRHNAYRGDGKDGQFCIVLPEQDAVVAITAKTGNMQAQLNIVWDKLLPAFGETKMAENPIERGKLIQAIGQLKASR